MTAAERRAIAAEVEQLCHQLDALARRADAETRSRIGRHDYRGAGHALATARGQLNRAARLLRQPTPRATEDWC